MPAPNDAKWLTSLGSWHSVALDQDWGRHWPRIRLWRVQTLMTEQLSLMFYFYQILISRERGRDHHPPPSSCSPPPPEISPVPDQTETLRRKYQGPVRQKTHNQYVWVTVCFWSALIWFLPISLSVSPPARSFPYFWFMIIKKQLMFVINIMQMDSGRRGRRSITMMDDWCGQLQLKTGIFITFNNGPMFCAAPTLSLCSARRCRARDNVRGITAACAITGDMTGAGAGEWASQIGICHTFSVECQHKSCDPGVLVGFMWNQ